MSRPGHHALDQAFFPEHQAGDLEVLRSFRKILRGAVTRLLKAATELRQAPSPSPSDLHEAINELVRKDAELNELNEKIGEIIEGDEFEFDYSDALLYQERVCRAVSRLRSTLNLLWAPGMRRHSPSGWAEPPRHTEDEAEHKDMPAGGSNEVAMNARNDKLVEQTDKSFADQDDSAAAVEADCEKRDVIDAKENIKHLPYQIEFIPVTDVMKDGPLPELPETRLAQIVEVVREVEPTRESESLPIPQV